RFKYDYVVLDEGHSIKNVKSSRFQRLRQVESRHRLLLSGTPVQNNLGELLALLSFLMPTIFRYDVIETLQEFLAEGVEGIPSSSSSSSSAAGAVRDMLVPFVLRRLKSTVLSQLSPKTEQATIEMVRKELAGYSDFDLHQLCLSFPSLSHLCLSEETLFTSAKMERLKDILPPLVADGHRTLLFSQWTRILDLLEVLLNAMGMEFCRLDGATPVSDRKDLIDKFVADKTIPVFLLSTRAGGMGINLTAADTVILHDVDFNPENDRQAEDRCHRIGQTKPVTVIKLVALGTVDEDIYRMGERKKTMSNAVLNDDKRGGGKDSTAVSGGHLSNKEEGADPNSQASDVVFYERFTVTSFRASHQSGTVLAFSQPLDTQSGDGWGGNPLQPYFFEYISTITIKKGMRSAGAIVGSNSSSERLMSALLPKPVHTSA
ncbi:unnamed protein product, partial [Discosporangium mesarthrocarpum]